MLDLATLEVAPLYWALLAGFIFIGCRLARVSLLSFEGIVIVLLSQYVAHAAIVFGISDPAVFCFSFYSLFVFSLRVAGREGIPRGGGKGNELRTAQRYWYRVCQAYLVLYGIFRFVVYPLASNELDLAVRLADQQQSAALFLLSLAYMPAVAGCIQYWASVQSFRFEHAATLLLVVALVYTSLSKGAILTLLLITVATLQRYKPAALYSKKTVAIGAGAILLLVLQFQRLFPEMSTSASMRLVMHRIVANSDSLSYLAALGLDPRQFPDAGVRSLVPFLSKAVGASVDYNPGVWLHGLTTGDWTGFGPNSGIVMDYFANLSWFGLVAAVLLALLMKWSRQRRVGGATFSSIASLAIIDVAIFQLTLFLWMSAAVAFHIIHPRSGVLSKGDSCADSDTSSRA